MPLVFPCLPRPLFRGNAGTPTGLGLAEMPSTLVWAFTAWGQLRHPSRSLFFPYCALFKYLLFGRLEKGGTSFFAVFPRVVSTPPASGPPLHGVDLDCSTLVHELLQLHVLVNICLLFALPFFKTLVYEEGEIINRNPSG